MASYGFPKVDNTEQVVANKQKKVVMFKEEVEQLPLHVEDDGGLEHYNEEEEEEEEEEGEEGEDGLGDERALHKEKYTYFALCFYFLGKLT